MFYAEKMAQQSGFFIIFDLFVTLTFELWPQNLISSSLITNAPPSTMEIWSTNSADAQLTVATDKYKNYQRPADSDSNAALNTLTTVLQ